MYKDICNLVYFHRIQFLKVESLGSGSVGLVNVDS